MPLQKSLRLRDDERKWRRARLPGRCGKVKALPRRAVEWLTQSMPTCWKSGGGMDDKAGRWAGEDGDGDEDGDECRMLLEEKAVQERPRYAASSLLRAGTPRRMREADGVVL